MITALSLEAHLIFHVINKAVLIPLLEAWRWKTEVLVDRAAVCRLIDRSLLSAPRLPLTLSHTESDKVL